MTVAIHISSRIKNNFLINCFLKLAAENLEDHFILISDGKFNLTQTLPENCTPVSLEPLIKNQLLKYYWYNYKLPSVLNRYNARIYYSPVYAASLKSKIPAIIFLHEFYEPVENFNASNLKYLRFAKFICSTNPVQLNAISEKYNFLKTKLIDIPLPVNEKFRPIDHEVQRTYQEKYSHGNDHFTTLITKQNEGEVITLLKAFSIFKKWQKSSFQLLIINKTGNESVLSSLETYKYKESVHLITYNEKDEADIISSSYTFFDLSNLLTGKEFILKAMNCGVPVISTISKENTFDDAIIYSVNSDKSLAEAMMRIYKDELLRNKIIEKGKQYALNNTKEKVIDLIKNITEKALSQTS